MTILIFLLVLSALVFIHELGHFLVAKMNGIRVDEFAIGFPPRIASFKKGETRYSINLLPLGGYVKIFGENPDEESISGADSKRSFVNKSKWAQAAVLVAGIVFNILFAWILFTGSFMAGIAGLGGEGDTSNVYITNTVADSPAALSGIEKGDAVIALSNSKGIETDVSTESVREFINTSNGEEITLSVRRNDEMVDIRVIPKEGISSSGYAIGIEMAEIAEVKLPLHEAIWEGAKLTVVVVKETAVGIVKFLWNIVTFNANLKEVAGPVGIAGLVGEASKFGIGYLLSLSALISINLAIINLIPFPALDGGRLLFVAIEAIIKRPINPKIANVVNLVGFGLLLLLMLLVTVSDVRKLF